MPATTEFTPMKCQIVADGESRWHRCPENQARLRELYESIRAKHEAELPNAGVLRHFLMRRRIAAEFRLERRKIEPSKESLYVSSVRAAK